MVDDSRERVEGEGLWCVMTGPVDVGRRCEDALGREQVVLPRLTEWVRTSRRSRRRAPRTVPQLPGYMFLRPWAVTPAVCSRWRLRPLLLGGSRATVQDSVVRHCLLLEERSASSPLPRGMLRMFRPGDLVHVVSPPLASPDAPLPARVESVQHGTLRLSLLGSGIPVVCSEGMVRLAGS